MWSRRLESDSIESLLGAMPRMNECEFSFFRALEQSSPPFFHGKFYVGF